MKPLHLVLLSVLAGVAVGFVGFFSYGAGRNAANNPAQPIASPSTAIIPATSAAPVVTWTQQENNYLFDLSQALQHSEVSRTSAADRLSIGHTIAGWLDAGADYWDVRAKFDAQYGGTPAAEPFNRDVYIKYATMRLSPGHVATLDPPAPSPTPIVVVQPSTSSQPTFQLPNQACRFFAGQAVEGQSINLDTCSISANGNGTADFVYYLGNDRVESQANCSDGSWTTFPEQEVHSPQSQATQSMVNKVCNGVKSNPPHIPPIPQPEPPNRKNCDPSYPTVCIASPPPDLNCKDIP